MCIYCKKKLYHLGDDTTEDSPYNEEILKDMNAAFELSEEKFDAQNDGKPDSVKLANNVKTLTDFITKFIVKAPPLITYPATGGVQGAVEAAKSSDGNLLTKPLNIVRGASDGITKTIPGDIINYQKNFL